MVELKDEEDGRVALLMDKEELPFAVEALMRVGFALTSPREAEAEEPEAEADEPEEPEAELDEPEEPEAEADEPEEPEAELDEPEEPEAEADEPERQSPVRRRGSRARRLSADATTRSRIRRS
jgi:outer membrane biosynthesis protein TonB